MLSVLFWGARRKAVGRKSPARTRHHSLSGYSVAVASALGCAEVELRRATKSWPAFGRLERAPRGRAHSRNPGPNGATSSPLAAHHRKRLAARYRRRKLIKATGPLSNLLL